MIVVGAGLAGLIAAHAWPTARVVESASAPRAGHAALLRFRTDAVARLTGVEFRKVRVRKGIWLDGQHIRPDIRVANMYSAKVLAGGRLGDRSIWDIEPVDRWVAPESLYDQLVDAVGLRIEWGVPWKWLATHGETVISTVPLPVAAGTLVPELTSGIEFERAPIHVQRFRLERADVFQTVYFPTLEHSVYRASITKDLLIVEHAGAQPRGDWQADVFAAFGIPREAAEALDSVTQGFGKIAPIPEDVRRRAILYLTQRHGIYSLGRFATWRNILLDDVVDDIAVIKRLIRIDDGSGYATRLHA